MLSFTKAFSGKGKVKIHDKISRATVIEIIITGKADFTGFGDSSRLNLAIIIQDATRKGIPIVSRKRPVLLMISALSTGRMTCLINPGPHMPYNPKIDENTRKYRLVEKYPSPVFFRSRIVFSIPHAGKATHWSNRMVKMIAFIQQE